jgi:hypothetical protein
MAKDCRQPASYVQKIPEVRIHSCVNADSRILQHV